MVMISPQIATTKPAPAESRTLAHRHDVAGGRAAQGRVGREGVLGLGHADRQVAEAGLLELGEARPAALASTLTSRGAVDLAWRSSRILSPERHGVGVERREIGLARSSASATTLRASSSAPAPPSAQCRQMTASTPSWSRQQLRDQLHARRRCRLVKWLIADDRRHAELADVVDMAGEVGEALPPAPSRFSLPELVLGDAAMHLERAHRRDDRRRRPASGPALRHLMSKNFSAPRSAPKPASVTT